MGEQSLSSVVSPFRRIHRFRQSDIKRFRLCPESHRRHVRGLESSKLSDRAEIGSSAHAGIHAAIQSRLDGESLSHLAVAARATNAAVEYWRSVRDDVVFTDAEIAADPESFISANLVVWMREVWPWILSVADEIASVETRFSELVWSDPFREVWFEGTRDLVLRDGSVIDWKTSRNQYGGSQAWKYHRYDVQSTIYSAVGLHSVRSALPSFTFGVMLKRERMEWLTIERTWAQVDALLSEVLAMCALLESDAPVWPMRATDWHCAPRWCASWADCMGRSLGRDPYSQLLTTIGE